MLPQSQYPHDVPGEEDAGLALVLKTLSRSGVKVYAGTMCNVLLFPNGRAVAMDFEHQGGITFFDARAGHLLDALLATWEYGRMIHAERVRRYLCDALRSLVAAETQRALTHYDMAVATTESGGQIICADWVVVYDRTTLTQFRGRDFQTGKIAMAEKRARLAMCRPLDRRAKSIRPALEDPTTVSLDAFDFIALSEVDGMGCFKQVLLKYKVKGKRRQRVLLTTIDQLTAPMPKGGRVIPL